MICYIVVFTYFPICLYILLLFPIILYLFGYIEVDSLIEIESILFFWTVMLFSCSFYTQRHRTIPSIIPQQRSTYHGRTRLCTADNSERTTTTSVRAGQIPALCVNRKSVHLKPTTGLDRRKPGRVKLTGPGSHIETVGSSSEHPRLVKGAERGGTMSTA